MKRSHIKFKIITAATVAVSIIVVILLNVAVSLLPASITHIDTTKEQLFTLTDWTNSKLNALNENVEIYFLCANEIEDENISELLNKYADKSDKINVTVKDTSVYPEFYTEYTEEALSDNSLIVVSGERSYTIDYYEIYQYSDSTYYFDGEGLLTSAIDYVTTDDLPKIYMLEGHGEASFSSELQGYIKKENIEILSLSLNGLTAVPDDAECVLINSPDRDISETEKDILTNYLKAGGNVMMLTDYTGTDMPALDAFINQYGLQIQDGIVFEENSGYHVPNYPYFIYPTEVSHDITDPIINASLHTLFPLAQGITVTDTESDTITVSELVCSTDTAYSKIDINSENLSKEQGDIDGPFSFAVEVTDSQSESKLILFSTTQFLDSNINSMVGNANYDLFLNSLTSVCKQNPTSTIRAKELLSSNVVVPELASNIIFIILTVIVPMTVVIVGITVVYIRKSR